MAPLGLQITTVGSLGGETFMGGDAVLIDECFWEIHATLGNCHITPKALGTVIDLTNDCWDLVTISGVDGHYKVEDPGGFATSCFWDLDGKTDLLMPNTAAKCG